MSRRAAARRYEISESVAIKWLERVERDGSREPAGHGGHRASVMSRVAAIASYAEFLVFNDAWMAAVLPYLCDGGVFGSFIDWRGSPTVHSAATKLGLVPLNLIVWAKANAGMGSLYRSQHELLPLFKKGTASHVNNV
jgi:DNA modification methylase